MIFFISRILIKYGDVFFIKRSDTKQWEFVDCSRVLSIDVDEDKKPIFYHIKQRILNNQKIDIYNDPWYQAGMAQNGNLIVPAEAVVHFSMTNKFTEVAPFGMSVLQPVYFDWKINHN